MQPAQWGRVQRQTTAAFLLSKQAQDSLRPPVAVAPALPWPGAASVPRTHRRPSYRQSSRERALLPELHGSHRAIVIDAALCFPFPCMPTQSATQQQRFLSSKKNDKQLSRHRAMLVPGYGVGRAGQGLPARLLPPHFACGEDRYMALDSAGSMRAVMGFAEWFNDCRDRLWGLNVSGRASVKMISPYLTFTSLP